MKRMQMEILEAIGQAGNIRAAAQLLDKNASNVSRGLKSLEEEIGCSLVIVQKKKVDFTAEGKTMRDHAEKFLEVAREIDQIAARSSGEVPERGGHNWSDREIRYMLVIEKYKSLSKASEELFVSQPSLSQMLRGFNEYFGEELFAYVHGQMVTTESGQLVMQHLRKLDSILYELNRDLEDFYEMRRGTVRVGITTSLGINIVPLIAPAFMRQFPDIRLRILENNSQELRRMLKNQKVDFCILHVTDLIAEAEMDTYQVYVEEPFYLVTPKRWQERLDLPKDRPLNAQDMLRLAKEDFVLAAKKTPPRDVMERIFQNVHVQTGQPYEPVASCSAKNIEIVKRLVMAGSGITFLPKSGLQTAGERNELNIYPLADELDARWGIALVMPQGSRLSRCSMELVSVAEKALYDFLGN